MKGKEDGVPTAHVWNYNKMKRTGRRILFIGRLHVRLFLCWRKKLLFFLELSSENCFILEYISRSFMNSNLHQDKYSHTNFVQLWVSFVVAWKIYGEICLYSLLITRTYRTRIVFHRVHSYPYIRHPNITCDFYDTLYICL